MTSTKAGYFKYFLKCESTMKRFSVTEKIKNED